ncbi:MAG: glycoside hydrolase family 127 protein, partial [Nitrospira sp.]|nr:glycoside hydrolase family 127 protein [Nitrospira sp.]
VERGPLVYCAEGVDNPGKVMGHRMSGKTTFVTEARPELLGGVVTVKAVNDAPGGGSLTLIPYYAWAHRGPNEMRVWFPFEP